MNWFAYQSVNSGYCCCYCNRCCCCCCWCCFLLLLLYVVVVAAICCCCCCCCCSWCYCSCISYAFMITYRIESFSVNEKWTFLFKKWLSLGCRHPVKGKFFKILEFGGLNMITLWIGPFWIDEKNFQFSIFFLWKND